MDTVTPAQEGRTFPNVAAPFALAVAMSALVPFLDAGLPKTLLSFGLPALAAIGAAAVCRRSAASTAPSKRRIWNLFSAACAFWVCTCVASVMGASPELLTFTFWPLALGALFLLDVQSVALAPRRTVIDRVTLAMVLLALCWLAMPATVRHLSGLDDVSSVLFVAHMTVVVTVVAFGMSLVSSNLDRGESSTYLWLGAFVTTGAAAEMTTGFGRSSDATVTALQHLAWVATFSSLAMAARAASKGKQVSQSGQYARVVAGGAAARLLSGGAAAITLASLILTAQAGRPLDRVASSLGIFLAASICLRRLLDAHVERSLLARAGSDGEFGSGAYGLDQQFRALVQHSSDVILIVNEEAKFSYISPSVQFVLGHSPEFLIGQGVTDIIASDDKARAAALLAMAHRSKGVTMNAEWRVRRADGTIRQVDVLVRDLRSEPSVRGIVLNLRDVTERRELERQLTHQALHDDLTGLPNRSMLRAQVDAGMARWLFKNESFSLLVVDIDDFKAINDSLGHVAGDQVLKTVSNRLLTCTRADDSLVRLDGDKFAVLLKGMSASDPVAHATAERILEVVQRPLSVEGRTLALRCSIGLACVTDRVNQAEDILRNADLALHSAKSQSRGAFVQFEASMYDSALRKVELEADLRRALELDELSLHYQPTVDLSTGCMEGVEALLRWVHPTEGFIAPADFIPLAEESGLIVPIGTWVLREACTEVRQWQLRYPDKPSLTLNVNLSAKQLDQPDIVDVVREVLEESGLPASTLVLEMTESVLMDNKPSTLAKMQSLVDLGVRLAIDDFGTGYSSLSYLRQFPISILKIDRSFVNGVGVDGSGEESALVQAILDLASTLSLTTVGEGIETAGQLAELRRMGCDIGQGFLLAKPLPAEDVCRIIEKTHAAGLPMTATLSTH